MIYRGPRAVRRRCPEPKDDDTGNRSSHALDVVEEVLWSLQQVIHGLASPDRIRNRLNTALKSRSLLSLEDAHDLFIEILR